MVLLVASSIWLAHTTPKCSVHGHSGCGREVEQGAATCGYGPQVENLPDPQLQSTHQMVYICNATVGGAEGSVKLKWQCSYGSTEREEHFQYCSQNPKHWQTDPQTAHYKQQYAGKCTRCHITNLGGGVHHN